ncbi:hydrogen peroxide-inducible genes activator [Abyssalbus ytuae]|uniref:LysR substrate-binding domain-containing protein n=1 Tax=Abyssalbus ytuae TaxID=2926907 RepID=A0A9E6ZP31_9FLAO|nr:hydrogen peroxide-inducible genes activator [Abyssalbus ytuae]UOB19442.1 LysR substrate-binding domain-containing protein [Abyssalbus ytuae]
MNIQQIEYILAVKELKNFGKAADKCFITQSTLSTMIGKFEEEIGIKVFDRKTKPVSITKEGEAIIHQLKVISKELTVLDELVQSLKGELSGELKIGIIPTVAPFILPEFLNDFARKFPKITFTISEKTTNNITDALLKRELDIGIMATPAGVPDLYELPLYNEPFVLYDCSKREMKEYVNVDSIDFNKFWLLEEGHCLHTQVKKICDYDTSRNNENINFNFKAGSVDSLIRFVKINKGLTMLPYLASLDLTPAEYKKITHFQSPVPVRTIGLVVHKHFVKKQILSLLQLEIQDKILPLLNANQEEVVVSPL